MSKIEELIKQYCPDGVEYKKLSDVCLSIKGQGLAKSDKGLGGEPIILYGELYTTYGNYINEVVSFTTEEKVKKCPKILEHDLVLPLSSTTKEAQIGKVSAYRLSKPAYLGGDALILRHKQNDGYLVHLLNGNWFENLKMKCVKGTTINHLDYKKMLDIKIPVPPLTVQEEIVNILDNFTELTAELTARKQQYNFYRDKLLTFEKDKIEWKTLKDLCDIVDYRGKTPKK